MISSGAETVLEIGVGTGIPGAVLKHLGLRYESMDIDPELHPDHAGSVLKMPFADKHYDVVCCFEVLEHLPFEHFRPALDELFRVARKAVILSLPDAKPAVLLILYVPRLLFKKVFFSRLYRAKKHIFDGEHYWEINKKGYPLNKIKDTIKASGEAHGFSPQKDYRVWENPYHHFFVMYRRETAA